MNHWQDISNLPSLTSNSVDVYKINLTDIPFDSILSSAVFLSAEEQNRLSRYRFKDDKKRFVAARIVTKTILSKYLGIPEITKIVFSTTSYGKPQVNNYDLHFNISHSENIILLAFSKVNPIGIDVEFQKSNVEFLSMAKHLFSEREYEALKQLKGSELVQAFYYCWTRKESIIKAIGQGLSFPLDQFAVSLSADEAKLEYTYWASSEKDNWSLTNIYLEPNYTAAFAIRKLDFSTNYFEATDFVKNLVNPG